MINLLQIDLIVHGQTTHIFGEYILSAQIGPLSVFQSWHLKSVKLSHATLLILHISATYRVLETRNLNTEHPKGEKKYLVGSFLFVFCFFCDIFI